MDQFAQTRAPDDLFDDDFIPIQETAPQPVAPSGPRKRGESSHRGGPNERGGRGRGRGRGQGREKDTRRDNAAIPSADPEAAVEKDERPGLTKDDGKPEAVRGDRSGTGGVRKPKLSEDELSERLASIKLKNVAREAAHARAEADEASFQQREQREQIKRREERQNRREMDSERERNRQRKMKAVQGREWDAEKNDEDMTSGRGRGSQFRRGAYGGVARDHGPPDGGENIDAISSPSAGYSERGDLSIRGPRGRGGRGGRGRGRGRPGAGEGYSPPTNQQRKDFAAPNTKVEADFPALPATKQSSSLEGGLGTLSVGADGGSDERPASGKQDVDEAVKQPEMPLMSPSGEGATWADQMESRTPISPG
ncbi:MAG: hypothetical protein M1837_002399 [Sclerophora amabilis]|nr:MAG: hypothetical protein M1837_002399 [Sclerophora amabilis]